MFIRKKGNMVLLPIKKVTEPIYDVIYKLKNNIAKVAQHGTWRKTESDNNSLIFPLIKLEHKKEQYEGGKYGAININGKIVIPLEHSHIGKFENNSPSIILSILKKE